MKIISKIGSATNYKGKCIQIKHQLAQQIPQRMFHQSTTNHMEATVSPAFLSSLPVKILFRISQNTNHLNIWKRKESITETVRLIYLRTITVGSIKHNHFQCKTMTVYTTFTRNADGYNTWKRMDVVQPHAPKCGTTNLNLVHHIWFLIPQRKLLRQ